jgi:hypothetical protein
MRTWQAEHIIVASLLFGTVALSGGGWTEWIGALAVQASFGHAGIAARMTEREALRERPEVDCYRWIWRYFLAKEAHWLVYFVAHRSWAALVGVVVFLIYPAWRRWYRVSHPVDGTARKVAPNV